MVCKCGSELSDDANFCSKCGERASQPGAAGIRVGRLGEVLSADKAEQARRVGSAAGRAITAGLRTEMGRSVAAGAALGAVIAVPIPFVGPVLGAAVGAALGAYRKF